MAPVLAAVKNQLGCYAKENSHLANIKIEKIYRGIDQADEEMVEGRRLYWKGFTSSSLSKDTAKLFGKNQYLIFLSTRLSHEYLIIPKELSHYDEEEVLIFPFLYFEVTKAQHFTANKTSNYELVQKPLEEDLQ